MTPVIDAALADARALADGGIDAFIVENWGDAPFGPGRVEAPAVAALAVVASEIRRALPAATLGVNVLRNDGRSALAVATATGASFIRVNVHAGGVLTDQGIVQTDAYALLRERRLVSADVAILADVQTKHAAPLAPVDIELETRDVVHRGLADGIIVSGRATGEPTALTDLKRVRGAAQDVPLFVGSGVTPETAAELLSVADGLIVGTYVKREGDVDQRVDPVRVRRLVDAVRAR
jgi:uncharacterized protein